MEAVMAKLDIQIETFNEVSAIMATIGEKTASAMDALKEQLAKIANKITEKIKPATIGMNDATMKLMETITSYRDTLTQHS
jgi:hypothetical protein